MFCRTGDGREVRRHEDFVGYLAAKDGSARVVKMDFDGRNDCVLVNWVGDHVVEEQVCGICE